MSSISVVRQLVGWVYEQEFSGTVFYACRLKASIVLFYKVEKKLKEAI